MVAIKIRYKYREHPNKLHTEKRGGTVFLRELFKREQRVLKKQDCSVTIY